MEDRLAYLLYKEFVTIEELEEIKEHEELFHINNLGRCDIHPEYLVFEIDTSENDEYIIYCKYEGKED